MKILSIGLILFFALGLISCSKELSRGKAEEILNKQDYGQLEGSIPKMAVEGFTWLADFGAGANKSPELEAKAEKDIKEWLSSQEANFAPLKNNGFITYNVWRGSQAGIRPPGDNYRSIVDYISLFVSFTILPTDKLKPYIISTDDSSYKVKLVEMAFDKITGVIKISDSESVVEFTLKAKDTPLRGLVKGYENYNPGLTRSAAFRKYDDGWRLAQ